MSERIENYILFVLKKTRLLGNNQFHPGLLILINDTIDGQNCSSQKRRMHFIVTDIGGGGFADMKILPQNRDTESGIKLVKRLSTDKNIKMDIAF